MIVARRSALLLYIYTQKEERKKKAILFIFNSMILWFYLRSISYVKKNTSYI